MRIMVLGATGMLGHKLVQTLGAAHSVTGVVRGAVPPALRAGCPTARWVTGMEAEDESGLKALLERERPHVVINAIGVVKQSSLAADPETTIRINTLFPHVLARLCRAVDTRLVHISTDCVFSGRRGGYTETDPSDAEDLYGRSKYLGEIAGPGCITLRTSMIGRELTGARGLVEWFLAQRGGAVRGFRHAVFSGFPTLELAQLIGIIVRDFPDLQGVCQVAADPIDKHTLLTLIRDAYGITVSITPDETFRCDRSLDGSRFRQVTGYRAPPWPALIQAMAQDPTPYDQWRATAGKEIGQ